MDHERGQGPGNDERDEPISRVGHVPVPDLFRTALDSMIDVVAIDRAVRAPDGTIADFVIEYLNPAGSDLAGRGAAELVGRRVLDAYPDVVAAGLFDVYRAVADTGEPVALDGQAYRAEIGGDDIVAWFDIRAARLVEDVIIIVTRDVTATRVATAELEEAVLELEAAQALAHIGIWQLDVATGAFTWSAELYRIFQLDPAVHERDRTLAYLRAVSREDRASLLRLAEAAQFDGRPFMTDHTLHLESGETVYTIVHGDVVRGEDGAVIRVWGTMQDVTESTRTEFALEATTSELEREHATVDALQQAILPELPDLDDLEISACYLPAGHEAKVGGDWYDVFVLRDGRIGLVVGDVAGHGLASAALMAQLRNGLRAYAVDGSGPGETLRRLNDLLRTLDRDGYATCLYAVYEPGPDRIVWAHAGHLPPVVVDDACAAAFLEPGGGTPLGARSGASYDEREAVLAPGSSLVLYTDGLIERRGEVIDIGLDRLLDAFSAVPPGAFDDFCMRLSTVVLAGARTADDVCLLALRSQGRGGGDRRRGDRRASAADPGPG